MLNGRNFQRNASRKKSMYVYVAAIRYGNMISFLSFVCFMYKAKIIKMYEGLTSCIVIVAPQRATCIYLHMIPGISWDSE